MEVKVERGQILVDDKPAYPDWSTDTLVIPAVKKTVRVEERVTGHYGADSWDTGKTEMVSRDYVVVPESRVPIPERYRLQQFPFTVRVGDCVSLNTGRTTMVALDEKGETVAYWSGDWACWRTPRKDIWKILDRGSFVPETTEFAFLEMWQKREAMASKQGMTIMPLPKKEKR